MNVKTIGIDLAKAIFQIHGVNEHGKCLFNKQLKRAQMISFFANLPPCLVGMEACSSAHYWARKLQGLGHTVKLMAPQFVKPYVKTNKNDAADAEAVCEAVSRPNMRFVPMKSSEQLAVLALKALLRRGPHRPTSYVVCWQNTGSSSLKALPTLAMHLPEILEEYENGLPGTFRQLLERLGEHLKALDRQVQELEVQLQSWHRENAASKKLA
ncbi:IS110 family transposase [Aeromonas veronii]|uniref:IS110 family transposase n=1 Tax=Aeromonas veronii TaxID=654 RepID=UPI0031FDF235